MSTGIFFDIDGTLRDIQTSVIPQSVKKTLGRLKGAGYHLGVATGRAVHEIPEEILDLADWDFTICSGGQWVYTKGDGLIYEGTIPADLVARCIEISACKGISLELMPVDGEKYLATPANRYVEEVCKAFDLPFPKEKAYGGERIATMMIYAPVDYDYHEYRELKELTVFPGARAYADIMARGTSKHQGVSKVLQHCGLTDYIAFGDAMNDYEMLLGAKIAVAMGECHPDILAVANYHTAPVLEDGIEKACIVLGLL